jgi:1-phosphofructokinase family hexose kinase
VAGSEDVTSELPRTRILFVAANPSIDRLYEVKLLEPGTIHRPSLVVAVAGGKGLNAARAAARLGGNVTAIGILGGRAGDWIADRLAEIELDARLVRTTAETRTCVSIHDRATGGLTEIYEAGEPIEPASWLELESVVDAELDRGDVAAIAFSGSLLPGAPTEGFARLARLAGRASKGMEPIPVIADSYGEPLAALLGLRPAIVKVNAAEAGEATGAAVVDVRSAVAAAHALRDRGASSAIVTLGLDGAVVATESGASHLVPPEARGAYPVGSGDAFMAGLAVGLVGGASVIEAARLGVAAGIANAQVPGAGELDPAAGDLVLRGVSITAV